MTRDPRITRHVADGDAAAPVAPPPVEQVAQTETTGTTDTDGAGRSWRIRPFQSRSPSGPDTLAHVVIAGAAITVLAVAIPSGIAIGRDDEGDQGDQGDSDERGDGLGGLFGGE